MTSDSMENTEVPQDLRFIPDQVLALECGISYLHDQISCLERRLMICGVPIPATPSGTTQEAPAIDNGHSELGIKITELNVSVTEACGRIITLLENLEI